MSTLAEIIELNAKEYLSHDEYLAGQDIPMLLPEFVIEQAKNRLPESFSDEKKEEILKKNTNLLSMMVVDCFAHYGAEGEKQHSEKNVTRVYESTYISKTLLDMLPNYVDILF